MLVAYDIGPVCHSVACLAALPTEGEVFSTKCWDGRIRADLIKSVTLCHDAQMMELYQAKSPLCPTILTSKPED